MSASSLHLGACRRGATCRVICHCQHKDAVYLMYAASRGAVTGSSSLSLPVKNCKWLEASEYGRRPILCGCSVSVLCQYHRRRPADTASAGHWIRLRTKLTIVDGARVCRDRAQQGWLLCGIVVESTWSCPRKRSERTLDLQGVAQHSRTGSYSVVLGSHSFDE